MRTSSFRSLITLSVLALITPGITYTQIPDVQDELQIRNKLSLFSLSLMVVAAMSSPTPGGHKKGPPGPPSGTYGGISQSCSASQSSIHCCNTNGNKVNKGKGKDKHVSWADGSELLVCSQIVGKWPMSHGTLCARRSRKGKLTVSFFPHS